MEMKEWKRLVGRVNRALRYRQVPIIMDVWEGVVSGMGEEACEQGKANTEMDLATTYLTALAEYWDAKVRITINADMASGDGQGSDSPTATRRSRKPAAD